MGVPLYLRIQQYVREKISSGEWPADQLIPSEAELSRQFGCSRITVTNALRELAKEGLIYRIQGKGTFAAPRVPPSGLYEQPGLFQSALSLEDMSLPGEHECVSVRVEAPGREVAGLLRLKPGQEVISIVRLKYVEGKPFSVEKVYLPHLLFLSVLEQQLEELPFGEIARRCDIDVGRSYISSEPVICEADVGELLGISGGEPILQFCIEIYDTRETPIACEMTYTKGRRERIPLQ